MHHWNSRVISPTQTQIQPESAAGNTLIRATPSRRDVGGSVHIQGAGDVNPLLSVQRPSNHVRGMLDKVVPSLEVLVGGSLHRLLEGGEGVRRPDRGLGRPLDPAFKRVMVFLFLGTKGGSNRIRVVRLLKQEALNANKIGERLALDYKTVQHHLRILEEHDVVVSSSPKGTYGAIYSLSQYFERQMAPIEEMWVKFGSK